MCEICELNKRCEKLSEEIEFRMLQYQKERNFGNLRAQKEARQRAIAALENIFIELDKIPELMEKIRSEQEEGGSFLDMFTKKSPVTH
ncbi:MAG TPA: hypothetical protein PLO50_10460 [Nitrospira sp.]|nr:hypothetical protein [Nitrospira sp.]